MNELVCACCGEIGELKQGKRDWWYVACKREGELCCMSESCRTQREALEKWAKLHEPAEPESRPA